MSENDRVVPFEGPSPARIMLVGEAPGEQEVKQGRPFVGGSGRILDKLLIDAGILRSMCRVGNVVRVRPPGNVFAKLSPEVVAEGVKYLKQDILSTKPNVVVALGGEPLLALTGKRGITSWRGSVLWSEELLCKVIPTIHPAAIMRQWDFAPLALLDLKRVKEEAKTLEYSPPNRTFVVGEGLERYLLELRRLRKAKRVAYDIESTRGDVYMTCIAFSDNPRWGMSVPFCNLTGDPLWNVHEEMLLMREVKGLLEDEGVEKVAQNAQFDDAVLAYRYGIHVKGLVLDTMCAFHTLMPELPKGLDTLCSIYTRQPYYKHWASMGQEQFWRYNCLDAMVTLEIAKHIEGELGEFGTMPLYRSLVHPLIALLLRMQLRGVRVDVEERERVRKEYVERAEKAQGELDRVVGREVNVNSPKALSSLLYGDLGLPPQYHRMTGKLSTDEAALHKLAASHPSTIFKYILEIRAARKLVSTYLDAPLLEGRIHCSYNIGGTLKESGKVVSAPETGRLSSSKSIPLNSGTNLQNVPEGPCRRVMLPDEGCVMVSCDLSQAEARVVAYIAPEPRLIEAYQKGRDVHRMNASWIFQVPEEKVTEMQRKFGKRHIHAFNYRESAQGFSAMTGLTLSRAREIRDMYFRMYPGIEGWHRSIEASLRKTRCMETPLGRKRIFFGRWGSELLKEATAYVPQSTVADLLNIVLLRFEKCCKENSIHADLLLQEHDGFTAQVRKEEKDTLLSFLPHIFNVPIHVGMRTLLIPYEVKVGSNWDEVEKEVV